MTEDENSATGRNSSAPSVLWVLFGYDGRIARQSFILGQLLMISLFAVVVARIVAVEGDESATTFWGFIMLLLMGAAAVSCFALTIKRLHDISLPGALSLILLVPTINVIFVIALMVLPSKQEINEYGPPPFG